MSLPASAPCRPARAPRGRYVEVLELDTHNAGPLHRRVPPSDEVDPARQRWIELAWRDPQAARRARLAQRRDYWQRRLHQHEQRLAAIRAELDAAVYPTRDIKPPNSAATVSELRCEFAACWADAQAARARLAEVEAELAHA